MQKPHAAALAIAVALSLALPVGAFASLTTPDLQGPTVSPGARIRSELGAVVQLLGAQPQALALGPCPDFVTSVRLHFHHLGLQAPADIPRLHDAGVEASVACLLDTMRAADLASRAMLAARGIDPVELSLAITRDDVQALEAIPAGDLNVALGAALALADRADDAFFALQAAPPASTHVHPSVPEYDLPPVLAVDHSGPTVYDCSYALVLDDNGDDLYDNNAGGSWLALGNMPIFFLAALPDRCSSYIVPLGPEDPTVAIGGEIEFGFILTTAMVLDTDGSDTYGVKRPPVLDAPCTSEPVVRRIGAQGAGIIGAGMLIDTAGDNRLYGKTLSQGLGHSAGVGVLYLGEGNDFLEAVRSAQGSGVLGAVGLLVNEGGDDQYTAHVPAGGTANIDLGSCDDTSRYMQGAGFGRITGVAMSFAGVLRDLGGNDAYEAFSKSQGAGEVLAHGVLIDEAGDDTYVAVTKAMGYGEGHEQTVMTGSGWFWDKQGNDVHLLDHEPGLGMGDGRVADPFGVPEPFIPPNVWLSDVQQYFLPPMLVAGGALYLDEGTGADVYSLADRGNDMTATNGLVGVFVDK